VDWPGILAFTGALLAAALLVCTAVWLWISRGLGRWLEWMARGPDRQGPGWLAALPVQRDDELGGIARNLQRLCEQTQQHEARANALEKNLHVQVADKTKRIEVMLQQAQKQTWMDALTRLYNRRFLHEKLAGLFEEQSTAGEDLSLVMLDIDHFKELNDTLGHAAGDDLLEFVGELLRGTLRPMDIGVRYGGDEFVIIMVGSSPMDASALAQRIVRLFAQRAKLIGVLPAVSMSAGVASLRASRARSAEQLVKLADAALYRAKRAGKNSVRLASP
jgi:diguanylate cyclase (GGDEF)-like protein